MATATQPNGRTSAQRSYVASQLAQLDAKSVKANQIKSKATPTYLPLSTLEICPQTQRGMRLSHVNTIVAKFDADKLGYIVVSLRDGRYYIVDGQHRVEALRKLGRTEHKVPVLLYQGLSVQEEADLYLGLQVRRGANSYDTFRIQMTSGDPVACDIDRIVRAQGLVVSPLSKNGGIAAVSSLRFVYKGAGLLKKDSPSLLARTIKVLKSTWGVEYTAFDGILIRGMGLVLARYASNVSDDDIARILSKQHPTKLLAGAKAMKEVMRRTDDHCAAASIVAIYNERKRSARLQEWWS